jgi:hypothetical protein
MSNNRTRTQILKDNLKKLSHIIKVKNNIIKILTKKLTTVREIIK